MRDRSDHLGAFSATRDGKRLNMLGFNTHLLDRDSAVPGNRNLGQPLATTNERDHRDVSGLMGAYSSNNGSSAQHAERSAYGERREGVHTRGEMLLSQSGVSHSALVNSGNAAILGHGHNSFKLSGAAQLAGATGANGPPTLGSTYGALGNSNNLQHPGFHPSQNSIF